MANLLGKESRRWGDSPLGCVSMSRIDPNEFRFPPEPEIQALWQKVFPHVAKYFSYPEWPLPEDETPVPPEIASIDGEDRGQ